MTQDLLSRYQHSDADPYQSRVPDHAWFSSALNSAQVAFTQGFGNNAVVDAQRMYHDFRARQDPRLQISEVEFAEKYSGQGFKWEPGMARATAELYAEQKRIELLAEEGMDPERVVINFLGGIAGSLAHPVDMATIVLAPEVKVGSVTATGARAVASKVASGALTGLVDATWQTPLIYAGNVQKGSSYTGYDALVDFLGAPVFGAAIQTSTHGLGRAFDRMIGAQRVDSVVRGQKIDPQLASWIAATDDAMAGMVERNKRLKALVNKPIEALTKEDTDFIRQMSEEFGRLTDEDPLLLPARKAAALNDTITLESLNARVVRDLSPDQQALTEVFRDLFGTDLRFIDGEDSAFVTRSPETLFVGSRLTDDGLLTAAGHELGHSLRTRNPQLWREVISAFAAEGDQKFWQSAWDEVTAHYKDKWTELSPTRQIDEATAHAFGKVFREENFWGRLKQHKPHVFTQVMTILRDLLHRLLLRGDRPSRQLTFQLADILAKADPEGKFQGPQTLGFVRDLYLPLTQRNRGFITSRWQQIVSKLEEMQEDLLDLEMQARALNMAKNEGSWKLYKVELPDEPIKNPAGWARSRFNNAKLAAGSERIITATERRRRGEYDPFREPNPTRTREVKSATDTGRTPKQLNRGNAAMQVMQPSFYRDGKLIPPNEWGKISADEVRWHIYVGGEQAADIETQGVSKNQDQLEREYARKVREEAGIIDEWGDLVDSPGDYPLIEILSGFTKGLEALSEVGARRNRAEEMALRKQLEARAEILATKASGKWFYMRERIKGHLLKYFKGDADRIVHMSDDELLDYYVKMTRGSAEQSAFAQNLEVVRQPIEHFQDVLDNGEDFYAQLEQLMDEAQQLPGNKVENFRQKVWGRIREMLRKPYEARIEETLKGEERQAKRALEHDNFNRESTVARLYEGAFIPEVKEAIEQSATPAEGAPNPMDKLTPTEQDLVRRIRQLRGHGVALPKALRRAINKEKLGSFEDFQHAVFGETNHGLSTVQQGELYKELLGMKARLGDDVELAAAMEVRIKEDLASVEHSVIREHLITRGIITAARSSRNPLKWLSTFLDGQFRRQIEAEGVGNSIEYAMQARAVEDMEPLVNVLKNATGLWDRWNADELSDDVLRWLETNGKGDFSPEIARIGKVLQDTYKAQVGALKKAGSSIRWLDGFSMSHHWDPAKMRSMGFKAFEDLMLQTADWERIYLEAGGMSHFDPETGSLKAIDFEEFPRTYIKGMWDELTTGARQSGDNFSTNLALQFSRHRAVFFKPGGTFIAMKYFGAGDTVAQQILNQIHQRSDKITIYTRLGPNPEAVWAEVKKSLEIGPDKPHGNAGLVGKALHEKDYWAMDNTFKQLIGKLDDPESMRLAQMGRSTRKYSNIAFLGLSGVSTLTDIPSIAAALSYQGAKLGPWGKNFWNFYKQALQAKNPRAQAWLLANGAGLDATLGAVTSRLMITDGTSRSGKVHGLISKGNDLMFQWNGLNFMTSLGQRAYMLGITRHLGENAIDVTTGQALARYGIDPAKFEGYRQQFAAEVEGLEGKRLSPDMIEDVDPQMARRFRIYLQDFMRQAVIEPGARAQAEARLGTRAGTPSGELVRVINQYITFPLAITHKTYGRLANGYGEKGLLGIFNDPDHRRMGHLLSFVGSTLAMGYIATVIKDLLRGREPIGLEEMGDKDNLQRILAQSGVAGIWGSLMEVAGASDPLRSGVSPLVGQSIKALGSSDRYQLGSTIQGMMPFATVPVLGPGQDSMRALLALVLGDSLGLYYQKNTQNRFDFIEREFGQTSIFNQDGN